jgi:stage IV sporulation protein FB
MSRGGRDGHDSPWAVNLGRPLGIPVRIHFTFLLLLVWFGYLSWREGGQPLLGVAFIVLLFACVLLHELGHAWMAKRFGVRTRQIVLYPIGGVASLEGMPSGAAELLIAVAGPLVNLVIAFMLIVAQVAFAIPWPVTPQEMVTGGSLLPRLLAANVALFAFNLIPAFPMDGGRVLRATLSFFMAHEKATSIAALVGQGIAILFGALGLFSGNFILVFIALFVFLGAGQEAAFERGRAAVSGRRARDAMVTRFDTLAPQDTLGRATELLLATHQQDFPVIDAWGRVAGTLGRSALLEGLARLGQGGAVLEVMRREPRTVSPDTPLDEVLPLFQGDPGAPILVADETGLKGMITLDNLGELIEVSRRLRES